MKKSYWIGPPEHNQPEDRVQLWLEPGDVMAPQKAFKGKSIGAKGVPYIIVGFDTEFKTPDHAVSSDEIRAGSAASLILSYQFYAKCSDGRVWQGICCPDGDARLTLPEFLLFVLGSGARLEGTRDIPSKVYLVGHFTRADVPAFADFEQISRLISAVRNTFITLDSTLEIKIPAGDEVAKLSLYLRDTMLLTPQSSRSLKKIGELVGVDKVELSPDREIYKQMIRNMDRVRSEQWPLFKAYALTDAEICVLYLEKVMAEYERVTGKLKVPVTLTGIGIDLLEKHWKDIGYDRLTVLGKEPVVSKEYSKKKGYYLKKVDEVDMRLVHYNSPLATDCYHGGRNEQYWFGPAFIDEWTDFDLSSAYPTAMAMIGMPDWKRMVNSINLDDYTPTTLGFAEIEFEFPNDTRYPTLPVRTSNGLIFPLKGTSECAAPEIFLARKLGAKITVLHGIIVPSDSERLVFADFIQDCINRRQSAGKNTLQGLFWKEISNSTYGKTAQGLKDRRVYDMRDRETKRLPPSRITNPYFAAFITSFVRAVLGEIMNAIPADRMVFSCTTDGFLTNISESQADACMKGVLCGLYRDKRRWLTGDDTVLERKHYVQQPIGWRTRGQATLRFGVPEDPSGKHVVLAKGGIWTPPEFEETDEQNAEILKYFFSRTPSTQIRIEGKTGMRDMVEQGADFVDKLIVKRLNMEFDWKRRPRGYTQSAMHGHVAFNTEPWRTVEQFVLMRDSFDDYQSGNPRCIKTIDDLLDLSKWVEVKTISSSNGLKYVRKTDGDLKRLRQMLCAAFKHDQAGFATVQHTNQEFAEILSSNGLKCSKADVENGLKKIFIPHQVPPTDRVLSALLKLKTGPFPTLESDLFLVELDRSSMMIRLVSDVECPFIAKVE